MTLLEKLENHSLLLFVVFEGTTKLLLLLVPVQNVRENFNN